MKKVKGVGAEQRVLILNSGPRAQHVSPSHRFDFFLRSKINLWFILPSYTQSHLFWWITCHAVLSPHCNASMKLVSSPLHPTPPHPRKKGITIFSRFSWGIDAQRGLLSFLSRALELWNCSMNVKAVDTAVSKRSCLSVWTVNMIAVLYLVVRGEEWGLSTCISSQLWMCEFLNIVHARTHKRIRMPLGNEGDWKNAEIP